jgi:hypothetical protein
MRVLVAGSRMVAQAIIFATATATTAIGFSPNATHSAFQPAI